MEKYKLKHQVEAVSTDTEEGQELLKEFNLGFIPDKGTFFIVKNWIMLDTCGKQDSNGKPILALINYISFNQLFERED